MPTAGTHITIIERLALDPTLRPLLGDPFADVSDPAGLKMRYARLGAVGPDLFYGLMDYGADLQDLTNFFAKYSGSVECIGNIMGELDAFGSQVASDLTFGVSDTAKQITASLQGVVDEITAIQSQLKWVVRTTGYNFWTVFEARRQQDKARTTWFWADYLHYVRSGRFVRELFVNAGDNLNLQAYAYGYLSHYITDVVGHPYVNQVVGAPWRQYWQRHHLVENFMDAYVWDRWHDDYPAPLPPSTEEAPLDTIRATPHSQRGAGAPFTFARLNDHIHIGDPLGTDTVDTLIKDICDKIDQGLEDIGIAEPNPIPPGNPEFISWTKLLADTLRATYPPGEQPPENLKDPPDRPDGFPTPDDIASAYVVLRIFLRFSTEVKIQEPQFPDIAEDVWNAITTMFDQVGQDIASITPPPGWGGPPSGSGGGFSLKHLWEALLDWVDWAFDTALKLIKAGFDLLRGVLNIGGTLLVDLVNAALYLIKKGLFDIYMALRFFLVRTAYAIPFTQELDDLIVGPAAGGAVSATSLWTVPRTAPPGYPVEEVPDPERTKILGFYAPWMTPLSMPEVQALDPNFWEMPKTWAGPYAAGSTPDALMNRPFGPRLMLSPIGPRVINMGGLDSAIPDFGGAIANCVSAFTDVQATLLSTGDLPIGFFPDYNLDGDRGYAWPCWDLQFPPTGLDPAPQSPAPVMVAAVTIP
jgi:hypothetical protein